MDNNSLFPMKYRLRKTDEPVEIVAWDTAEKGARSESDWGSYIDAQGNEHIKEHLTLEWDFVIDSPFESLMSKLDTKNLPELDVWESRRYEIVKDIVLRDYNYSRVNVYAAVSLADNVIEQLKAPSE